MILMGKEKEFNRTGNYYEELADFEAALYFYQCERRRRYKLYRIKTKIKAIIKKCTKPIIGRSR